MECPKCMAEQDSSNQICTACGIVFAKYYKYHPLAEVDQTQQPQPTESSIVIIPSRFEWLVARLFYIKQPLNGMTVIGQAAVFAVLLVWGVRLMSSTIASGEVGSSFMHLINLPFHEAGHVIFRPFGAFITSLGGTLGQLLMPLICLFTLLVKTRDPFGASVSLCWFGENFLDIAPYINDARAGVMPLVGGNFGHSSPYGFHGWEFLLTESGLIRQDHLIAKGSFF